MKTPIGLSEAGGRAWARRLEAQHGQRPDDGEKDASLMNLPPCRKELLVSTWPYVRRNTTLSAAACDVEYAYDRARAINSLAVICVESPAMGFLPAGALAAWRGQQQASSTQKLSPSRTGRAAPIMLGPRQVIIESN